MQAQTSYLSLKEAARRPGVHEQTLERGRLLAAEIKRELAARDVDEETPDDVMRRLRGQAWAL